MNSNLPLAHKETAKELADIRHWAPLLIPLAAALILGMTAFIWMEVFARL